MNKRAFTLVELIISIFLLGIIVVFLYSTVASLQKTNKIFQTNEQRLKKSEKILDLLYEDIFSANDLNTTGRENSLLNLQTKNSIYNISMPYVSWFVSREKNTLLRFESVLPFSKLNSDNSFYYHISKVGENCEKFKVYQSKNKEYILIYIKFKNKEAMIYEFYKPFIKKKVLKKGNISNPHTPNISHNPHKAR